MTMFYPMIADTWGSEEIEAIQEVIASGRYTMADNVAAFEVHWRSKMSSQSPPPAAANNAPRNLNIISNDIFRKTFKFTGKVAKSHRYWNS